MFNLYTTSLSAQIRLATELAVCARPFTGRRLIGRSELACQYSDWMLQLSVILDLKEGVADCQDEALRGECCP